MALLTARELQNLLDEATAFLRADQGKKLAERLNRKDSKALAAEWELIFLSALYREGSLVHEPDFGGPSKLDFLFEHGESDMKVVGDVTAVSDDAVQRNSIDLLSRLLPKKLDEMGIRGQLSVRVDCEAKGQGVVPRLPPLHEFRKYIFGSQFNGFALAIRANPGGNHQVRIDNEKAGLSIAYSNGGWNLSMSYQNIRGPRDLQKNVLANALEKKNDQIKNATRDFHSRSGRLEFSVEVFDRKTGIGEAMEDLLTNAFQRLPKPICIPANAKTHIERRFGPYFIYDGARSSEGSHNAVTISSRALVDYLTGSIDRERFELVVDPFIFDLLRNWSKQGSNS
jgi:hypothetical protein